MKKPIIALMYDFDLTLSPRDMQEYAFIPSLGVTPTEFWAECNRLGKQYEMDGTLAYMYFMIKKARGKALITKDTLRALGDKVELFCGVEEWFDLINKEGESRGFEVKHFIISSGIKQIIEGTKIADKFEKVFACEFCYDEDGVPFWPAVSVNYTSKTQFLFRINKGVFDISDSSAINELVPEEKKYIPFKNMIYIGDGLTDVPCMKLTKNYGGHSIGVYSANDAGCKKILADGRVDYMAKADYTKGGEIYNIIVDILTKL